MLEEGIIEESDSPWASAYVIVKKKTGDFRLCVDFRRLNEMTKKTVYPLPNIDDCLNSLSGKKYFSQLDFASGFWQIQMAKASKEMTAFRTEDGLFHFNRMPFGLTNAPASFQRMINIVLSGLKGLNLQCFMDDVCIATASWHEHLILLEKVLQLVIKAQLKLKPAKCTLGASEVVFLGHLITADGIRQEPKKLKAMLEMPVPSDAKGVRRVMGFLNYYRKFVPNFSIISEPITKLTRKNVPFVWGDEQRIAFDTLLQQLGKNAVLAHYNYTDPLLLKTDASHKGVASILLQKQMDEWKIVSCSSRQLSKSELNYGITDLEGLAVVEGVKQHRNYLLGRQFQIMVDHCALCVLNKRNPASPRLKRWAIALSEYDFNIVYTKGTLHEDVDCLSRAPVDNEEDPYLNHIFFAIPDVVSSIKSTPPWSRDKLSRQLIIVATSVSTPVNPDSWLTGYDDDTSKEIVAKAKNNLDNFSIRNEIIYHFDQLYVPANKVSDILFEYHDSLLAGHPGVKATLENLTDKLWWPTMKADVEKHIGQCKICQIEKPDRSAPAGVMRSFDVCEPLEMVSVDTLGPITTSLNGNKHVMVIIDVFTRFVQAKAVPDITSNTFAKFLCDFCGTFGIPRKLLSDNALSFQSKLVSEIMQTFGIKHIQAAPYHSQGNAPVERVLETLQEKLRISKDNSAEESSWDVRLPVVVLSMNSNFHSSTRYQPYELMFGRKLERNNEICNNATPLDLHARLIKAELELMLTDAAANQAIIQTRNKSNYDRNRQVVEFKANDLVLARNRGRKSKLASRYIGPFRVVSGDKDIYVLENCNNNKKIIRHAVALKRYITTSDDDDTNNDTTAYVMTPPTTKTTNVAIALLVSTILLGCVTKNVENQVLFERVAPILWSAQPITVEQGIVRMMADIRYMNPCIYLQKYPMGPANNDPLEIANRNNGFSIAFDHCNAVFLESISNTIRDLNNYWIEKQSQEVKLDQLGPSLSAFTGNNGKRKKRQYQIGFIAGFFFSDVYKTIKEKVFGATKDEVQERQHVLDTKLIELEKNFNATYIFNEALTNTMKITAANVIRLNSKINHLTQSYPDFTVVTSYTVNLIVSKGTALKKLSHSIRNSKTVDLFSLGQLTEPGWLEELDASAPIEVEEVKSNANNQISVTFVARKKSLDTKIYRIEAIRYWANLTGTPTLMEYSGENLVAYNSSSNCIKAVTEAYQRYVTINCEEKNFEDSRLKSWKKIIAVDNPETQPMNTTIKEGWPFNYVYCYTLNITLNGVTTRCPDYPFKVNATYNFNCSDGGKYVAIPERILLSKALLKLEHDVHPVHFKENNHLIDETLPYRVIAHQKELLKESNSQKVAFGLLGQEINFSLITYSLLIFMLLLLCSGIVMNIKNKSYFKKRQEEVIKTVTDATYGDGTYETIKINKKNTRAKSKQDLGIKLRTFTD